jgi:hypothetical protein
VGGGVACGLDGAAGAGLCGVGGDGGGEYSSSDGALCVRAFLCLCAA